MNQRLQELIDYTQEQFGLSDYDLRRHHFFRELNNFDETAYVLSMEWFPKNAEGSDEDLNPPGTAVIDMNFHTKAVQRTIFVGDDSFANRSLYPSTDKESTIEWIEELTGLTFGRQFLIDAEEDNRLRFRAAVDNIPVWPGGTIEVKFNDDGALTLFSIDGNFPNEEQIQWEPFGLTPDKFEPLAKEQCRLIKVPDEEREKWLLIYGFEEIFITNDGGGTFPFGDELPSYVNYNKIMEWEEPVQGAFERQDFDFSPEVTLDDVLANKAHPDTIPLTESELSSCLSQVLYFMRMEYPDDSGKRKLSGFYLKDGYIIAEIRRVEELNPGMDLKIKLIIDRESCTVVNYFDQDVLLGAYEHIEEAGEPVVSQEEAFEKLRGYLEIEPVYVFDREKESYIMCGKLDCGYGVNAVTGEVLLLSNL
ncbi:hypothetical protein [Virgibacillus doumboii]|uniref:hypothetical protein n=1 Tax=Virgibacillus doumboii TaxID=2697503 RepID=UPI0013DFF64D|nr:hypothetical protein [Virgibacillus doumboii]